MLLIGEGTADIQRMIIGRRLLEDYKLEVRRRGLMVPAWPSGWCCTSGR